MSFRALTVLLTALAVLIAYLYFEALNPEPVVLKVSQDTQYEISKMGLVALAFAAGVAVVVLMVFVEDIRRGLVRWKRRRHEKREARIQTLLAQGHQAVMAMRTREAQEIFQKVLEQDPGNVDALIHLGTLKRRGRHVREATTLHQQAWRLQGNLEALQALLADYEAAGRWEDALRLLDEALQRDPDNPGVLLKKREILERLGRWEEALEVQETLLKGPLAQEDPEAEQRRAAGYRTEAGYAHLSQGDLERAQRAFKSVLKTRKDFAPAYLGLAEAALREGNPREAQDVLERGFRATHNPILLERLETLCLEEGDPSPAILAYRDALARSPKNPLLALQLAKLYYRLEMIDDAFEILSETDAAGSAAPDWHRLLGQLHLRREAPELAVQEFLQALRWIGEQARPYRCAACGHGASRWTARCSRCGAWDRIQLDPAVPTWEGQHREPAAAEPLHPAEGAIGER